MDTPEGGNERRSAEPGDTGLQVLPDLFVVSWLGMCEPRIDCHVYVLRGDGGYLLIDCGTPWAHGRILQNMAHWDLDPAAIRTALLTHGHVDHSSGGALFKQCGVDVLGHREVRTLTECQWQAQGILDADNRPYSMDGALKDGDRLSRCGFDVDVFHTPGHSRGCVTYLVTVNGKRCLFSGDLIMGDGLPGWGGDPGHDRAAIVSALGRLRELSFDHLCYGHGVELNDRGHLFGLALEKESSGAWDHPDSHYQQTEALRRGGLAAPTREDGPV